MKRPVLARAAIVVLAVLALEAACRFGLIRRKLLVPPSEMAIRLGELLRQHEFWLQFSGTARNIVIAFAFALVAGFCVGVVLHGLPMLRRAVEPMIASWYALPFFVLYPLFIVMFGMNAIPIVIVGFLYAFMAMVTGTLGGLDRIPPVLDKVSRTYRLDRVRDAFLIKLPAAAPHVFTGSKLALGYAVTGVIGSEFILANSGLGYSIAFAYNDFDDRTMYGMLLFVILLVSALTIVLHALEQRVQHRSGAGHASAKVSTSTAGQRGLVGLAIVAAILVAWQLLHWKTGQEAIASPLTTAFKINSLMYNPEFWLNLQETARALGYSLLLSCLGGAVLGIVLGASRTASEIFEPMLVTLYSLPKVTLYPVVLLFCGIGIMAKIVFGALYGMIPMILITMNAIRSMNPVYRRTARAMRLTRGQSIAKIMVPATLPELVTGLRISFSITLLGVMIGEMFASKRGLGFMIMNSIGVNDTPTLMAVTVLIGVFAVVINSALLAIDRRAHRA